MGDVTIAVMTGQASTIGREGMGASEFLLPNIRILSDDEWTWEHWLEIAGMVPLAKPLAMVGRGGKRLPELPDEALVCRGGTCTADRFVNGSGVTVNSDRVLEGVSVQSGVGARVDELGSYLPNNRVGVTTVGDIRAAGGNVVPSPTPQNPYHATLGGITPEVAERLMTPTVRNPVPRGR